MSIVKIFTNASKSKRSLTEYGYESYAAGDLFAFAAEKNGYFKQYI